MESARKLLERSLSAAAVVDEESNGETTVDVAIATAMMKNSTEQESDKKLSRLNRIG